MALSIKYLYPTAATLYATLKKENGDRWSVLASAWEAAPTYANSKILLTEGAAEYLQGYSASVSGLGDAGAVTVFIHNGGDSDKVVGQGSTVVMGGNEVTLFDILEDTAALNVDIYTAVIEAVLDATNTDDEYSVRWRKNGVNVTSGITSPTIQVIKYDGTDLIASTAMTQIGSTGAYKYSEGTNRIATGQNYEVKCTATIDSATRTFSKFVARDDV